ncbi:MAG TPA: hypothetical protein VKQ30_03410 [Ktedonobacterales bacterium]|nr:hypothetical protein [Ktedonobacterales bacterium]
MRNSGENGNHISNPSGTPMSADTSFARFPAESATNFEIPAETATESQIPAESATESQIPAESATAPPSRQSQIPAESATSLPSSIPSASTAPCIFVRSVRSGVKLRFPAESATESQIPAELAIHIPQPFAGIIWRGMVPPLHMGRDASS